MTHVAGKVYLIGAGPGAVDLITLRGAELLKRADIVFHDALVQPEMLALAPGARKVAVGKRCSRISTDQRFINRNLIEAAAKYDIVVRLKGGDPMLFGRAHEEIEALESAGVAYEIVPGVTAAQAASSHAPRMKDPRISPISSVTKAHPPTRFLDGGQTPRPPTRLAAGPRRLVRTATSIPGA
jgi:siroheme synthase